GDRRTHSMIKRIVAGDLPSGRLLMTRNVGRPSASRWRRLLASSVLFDLDRCQPNKLYISELTPHILNHASGPLLVCSGRSLVLPFLHKNNRRWSRSLATATHWRDAEKVVPDIAFVFALRPGCCVVHRLAEVLFPAFFHFDRRHNDDVARRRILLSEQRPK